jgi:hypothetical protein
MLGMDVGRPIASIIPTLDGTILQVLARTTRRLTGREVHKLAGVGSESGVRLALGRLVDHGLVEATQAGKATLYVGNRDHLAWPAIEILSRLREHLVNKLEAAICTWPIPPLAAALFGSAARGDGDNDSDIDILLISPREADDPGWDEQVDQLRDQVIRWTGNICQIYEITKDELVEHIVNREPIVEEWRRDAVVLFGSMPAEFELL